MRAGVCVSIAVALARAGAGCDVFSLNDVVPSPTSDIASDAPSPGSASCDAGIVSCGCVPPATLVATGAAGLVTLRTDGINAYWIAPSGTSYSVYSAPIDGSATTPVALIKQQPLAPGDLAFDHLLLYVVVTAPMSAPVLAGVPIPQAGDPSVTGPSRPKSIGMVPRLPVDLAGGGDGIYWTDDNSEICSDFTVFGANGCGGPPFSAVLGPTVASPGNHLAVGAHVAYLSVQATGQILRVPLVGGSPTEVSSGNPEPVRFLAGVDEVAFWADDSALFKSSELIDAGAATDAAVPFLAESAILSDLVIDDPQQIGDGTASVYFVTVPKTSSKGRPPTPTPQPSVSVGRVWSASQATGRVQQLLSCNVHEGTRLALDVAGNHLLWGDPTTGYVWSVQRR